MQQRSPDALWMKIFWKLVCFKIPVKTDLCSILFGHMTGGASVDIKGVSRLEGNYLYHFSYIFNIKLP